MKTPISGAVAAALSLVAVDHASAHAFLKNADPAVGSVVAIAPTEVRIDYTENVEPSFSTIVVTDGHGARVDLGKPHLDGGDAHLAVALKPLVPGTYKVVWHVTATDTHRTEGSFRFTIR